MARGVRGTSRREEQGTAAGKSGRRRRYLGALWMDTTGAAPSAWSRPHSSAQLPTPELPPGPTLDVHGSHSVGIPRFNYKQVSIQSRLDEGALGTASCLQGGRGLEVSPRSGTWYGLDASIPPTPLRTRSNPAAPRARAALPGLRWERRAQPRQEPCPALRVSGTRPLQALRPPPVGSCPRDEFSSKEREGSIFGVCAVTPGEWWSGRRLLQELGSWASRG